MSDAPQHIMNITRSPQFHFIQPGRRHSGEFDAKTKTPCEVTTNYVLSSPTRSFSLAILSKARGQTLKMYMSRCRCSKTVERDRNAKS